LIGLFCHAIRITDPLSIKIAVRMVGGGISEASDISELLGSNTGHYYQNTSARN
jgi:hypothetical protein